MHTISAVLCKYWLYAEFARMPRSDNVYKRTHACGSNQFFHRIKLVITSYQYFILSGRSLYIPVFKVTRLSASLHSCITKLNAHRITCQLHVQESLPRRQWFLNYSSALASRRDINILAWKNPSIRSQPRCTWLSLFPFLLDGKVSPPAESAGRDTSEI